MSLVMVLLLTLAVSQIFRVTASTIGKGNATGEVIRGIDSTRIALQIDFTGTDGIGYGGFTDKSGILPADRQPAIIISSTSIPAFMSQRDLQADEDGDPTTLDWDNDGIDNLPALGPFNVGRRVFRLDSLSFFTGGKAESQKNLEPSGGGFYGDTSSDESWVWYGHARVYDGSGPLNLEASYLLPAGAATTQDTNPHNFFANQFVLLRNQILLKSLQSYQLTSGGLAPEATVLSDSGVPVLHGRATWDPMAPAMVLPTNEPEVGPLAYDSPVAEMDDATGTHSIHQHPDGLDDLLQHTRVDVAGVTPATYRERLFFAQRAGAFNEANGPLSFNGGVAQPVTWYNRLFARVTDDPANAGRFWINPLVVKPLDAGEVSQASSYLLGGATGFIVEYAGDFLAQTETGAIDTAAPNGGIAPDGVIDFTVDATGTRHIRFYGMPRDVDGTVNYAGQSFVIPGPGSRTVTVPMPGGLADSDAMLVSTDVRPLADYLPGTGTFNVNTGLPFEKRLPADYQGSPERPTGRAQILDYGILAYGDLDDTTYLAAWGPHDFDGYPVGFNGIPPELQLIPLRPSLIRVIVQGIDRQNRLEEPLSMELIFRVPAE